MRTGTALVEARDIWYAYPDGEVVLQGASIALQPGELVALIGPNGAGKTTLAKHLNGLLRPDRGRVLSDGKDVADYSVAEMASQVGYVFQNPDHQIFSGTVRDELAFGPRNLGLPEVELVERVESILQILGLEAYAKAPPALLSFGLRRLISLASVLTMQPRLLILDEPTKGLDARLTGQLIDIIRPNWEANRAVLLITHDMSLVAEQASRCAVMHEGRILREASPREIFSEIDRWRAIGVQPPQVTQLAASLGWFASVLTVDEFCHQSNDWFARGEASDADC